MTCYSPWAICNRDFRSDDDIGLSYATALGVFLGTQLVKMLALANLQPFAATGDGALPWAEATANLIDVAGLLALMRMSKVGGSAHVSRQKTPLFRHLTSNCTTQPFPLPNKRLTLMVPQVPKKMQVGSRDPVAIANVGVGAFALEAYLACFAPAFCRYCGFVVSLIGAPFVALTLGGRQCGPPVS